MTQINNEIKTRNENLSAFDKKVISLAKKNVESRAEFTAIFDAENAALDDWWMRYHEADEKTRELMRCGAIA